MTASSGTDDGLRLRHGAASRVFYGEPGASAVTERLRTFEHEGATGVLSHATATEVVNKIARLETGDPSRTPPGDDEFDVGEQDLRILGGTAWRSRRLPGARCPDSKARVGSPSVLRTLLHWCSSRGQHS